MKKSLMQNALRFALAASKSKIAELTPPQIKENSIHLRYLGQLIELIEKMGSDDITAYLERYKNVTSSQLQKYAGLWP